MHRAFGRDVLRLCGVTPNDLFVGCPSAPVADYPRRRASLYCFHRIDLDCIRQSAADNLGSASRGGDCGRAIFFPTKRVRS